MDKVGYIVNLVSSTLWSLFLPLIIILGIYVIIRMGRKLSVISAPDRTRWSAKKMKSALSISVSSKVGTGAVIGVLAALWKSSDSGVGGEAVVLWALVAMAVLVPLTYAEVLFAQVTKKMSREFVAFNLGSAAAVVYVVGLALLYAFGFVGFQFTGMQTVINILSDRVLGRPFLPNQMLLFVIIPMVAITAVIIITKNHELFIDVLGSLISIVIVLYMILFFIFLARTVEFVPVYFRKIGEDFLRFRSAALGLPIGFILAFQRIIQTSETALGTSALASSDEQNSPRREALLQVIATLLTLFVALVITSYIYSYGRYSLQGVVLTSNGFERITGYIETLYAVTGPFGLVVILLFFLLSGYCTVLGSFHFINTTMRIGENRKIAFYLVLITASGLMSLSHFSIIFDIADLLMFVVGSLFILSMFRFTNKHIDDFSIRGRI